MPINLKDLVIANKSQFILMFGTLIAQVFSTLSIFLVANKINPTEYGEYSWILISLNILTPISLFKLEVRIVNANENEVSNFFKHAILKLVSVSVFILVPFWFIVSWFWNFPISKALTVLSFIFLLNIVINSCLLMIAIALRKKNYLSVAISSIIQNASTIIFQVLFLKFGNSLILLLSAFLLGRFLSILVIFLWKDNRISIARIVKNIGNDKGNKLNHDVSLMLTNPH